MIKGSSNDRLKSLLLEAVVSVCKSWVTDGKVGLTIEGLLAITIKKEVVLINMKEQITTTDDQNFIDEGQLATDLNIRGSSDDIMNNLGYAFGPFLTREDCDKGAFEDMLNMEVQSQEDGVGKETVETGEPMKIKTQAELEDNLLKSTIDYSGLSLPDVSSAMERFDVSFDDNPSTLFGHVDFDDIMGKQHKGSNSSLDITQNILLNEAYVDLSFKNLERSTGDNFSNELLVVSSLHEWGSEATTERIAEVGPLNLAGPQDLSLGLDKRKFICGACGSLYTSELGHACKSARLNNAGVTGEPLNLKSQPLDLTTGPIYLAMDGSLTHQPLIKGATSVNYDLLTKHTLSSARDKAEAFKKCEICGKYLFSNSGYLKHKKQHAGKFRYVCEFCHKGFFDQTNLKMHIDSSHSKLKRHECMNCSKRFFWKHHLKRHGDTCKGVPISAPLSQDGSFVQTSSSGHSLPVISNFLVSIDSRSLPSVTTTAGASEFHCSTGRSNLRVLPSSKQTSKPSVSTLMGFSGSKKSGGGMSFLATPSDFSQYLGNVPGIPGAPTKVANSSNPQLTFLSLPQTVIIQVQNMSQASQLISTDTSLTPIYTSSMSTSTSFMNLIGQGSSSLPLPPSSVLSSLPMATLSSSSSSPSAPL